MKKRRMAWYWLLSLPLLAMVLDNASGGGATASDVKGGSTPGISGATLSSSSNMERRWKCHRLGKLSTVQAANSRCWFYCFDESLYRIYRLPEPNGTPCLVDKNYPQGTCRYSRCRQPNMKKRWWLGKLFRKGSGVKE
ncbi:uncharacterized protein LOC119446094 [Dermacentor silvarum]|uniref:uncharacterized protein LOC119446094 n=1 Tax=Dermacentor silvarum TaxID=543639 RepID=UPI00189B0FD2|nr:uncharacterized protein LOC119446094 [Dermacentor silvarum]